MDGEGLTEQAEELEVDSAGGREPETCLSKAVWTRLESEWREGREGLEAARPKKQPRLGERGWRKGRAESGGNDLAKRKRICWE